MSSDLVVIIGGGPSGIIAAHSLKHKYGHNNFVVLEKTDFVGGTWSRSLNNYPGESSLEV